MLSITLALRKKIMRNCFRDALGMTGAIRIGQVKFSIVPHRDFTLLTGGFDLRLVVL